MKTLKLAALFALAFSLISVKCFSDDATKAFTDPAFAKFCLDNFDKNKDGKLSNAELESVKSIIANNLQAESLAGIEKFTNLTQLIIESGNIKKLDVSKNTKLSHIACGGNKLKKLDFSKNNNLKVISCGNQALEELILPQGSNDKLNYVGCSGANLASLDISRYKKFESLVCQNDPPFKLYVWAGFKKENLKQFIINPETQIIEK